MNRRQQAIVLAGALIVVGMLLYPPFKFTTYQGVELNLGYSWLFSPPETHGGHAGNVNLGVLVAQWFAVCVVCGAVLLFFNSSSPRPNEADPASIALKIEKSPRQGLVIGLLRTARGVVGIVALYQIISMWPVFTWLGDLGAVTGNMWAFLAMKIAAFAILVDCNGHIRSIMRHGLEPQVDYGGAHLAPRIVALSDSLGGRCEASSADHDA